MSYLYKNSKLRLGLVLWVGIAACQSASTQEQKPQQESSLAARQVASIQADTSLAGVYAAWDGHWKGTFTIYLDPRGQQDGLVQPSITDPTILDSLPLEVSGQLAVEQFYDSSDPYYQTVRIIDTYQDGRQVESQGYNAVRGDSMLCVVNKPDEQVIHLGRSPRDSVIIWGRKLSNPTKIEYFYEAVKGNTYSILGWGYYGQDDPNKSPRMWFWAEYEKVDD